MVNVCMIAKVCGMIVVNGIGVCKRRVCNKRAAAGGGRVESDHSSAGGGRVERDHSCDGGGTLVFDPSWLRPGAEPWRDVRAGGLEAEAGGPERLSGAPPWPSGIQLNPVTSTCWGGCSGTPPWIGDVPIQHAHELCGVSGLIKCLFGDSWSGGKRPPC